MKPDYEEERWCDRGDDFDESCKFFATGYVMLARFLPDELAEKAAFELGESEDKEVLRVYYEASEVAGELQERRRKELSADWRKFQEEYQDKY